MVTREALILTFFGMGIVFVVLAIDYFSILVIRIFKREGQMDLGITARDVEPEFIVGKEPVSIIPLQSARVPHGEIGAAIMAAICAWEAQEGRDQDYP